jgi:hypothetical protein
VAEGRDRFSRQFLDLEKDEEQTSSLATVLAVLKT